VTAVESTIAGSADVDRMWRLLSLAGREARRLARHPALWLPLAMVAGWGGITAVAIGFDAGTWYAVVAPTVTTLAPAVAIFAANLVASSGRRVRAEEMLSVAPMSDTDRTLAMCLGVVLTLGGIGGIGALVLALIAAGGSIDVYVQTAGELAQIPPIVAGGGLLGVLTARWLRFPGAALVSFVIFVLAGGLVVDRLDTEAGTWWYWWSTWPGILYEGPPRPGEPWWHAAYLVGLCVCVTVAAVYRDRAQWHRLAAVGVPAVTLTVVCGLLQLP
jgi:hypothetical protein